MLLGKYVGNLPKDLPARKAAAHPHRPHTHEGGRGLHKPLTLGGLLAGVGDDEAGSARGLAHIVKHAHPGHAAWRGGDGVRLGE